MSRKLERLFEDVTGVDPRSLLPKPTGSFMQDVIKSPWSQDKIDEVFYKSDPPKIELFTLLRVGEMCGDDYAILGGLTKDHIHMAAVVYQKVPKDGFGIEHVVKNIPRDDWFELNGKEIKRFKVEFAGISRELEDM